MKFALSVPRMPRRRIFAFAGDGGRLVTRLFPTSPLVSMSGLMAQSGLPLTFNLMDTRLESNTISLDVAVIRVPPLPVSVPVIATVSPA